MPTKVFRRSRKECAILRKWLLVTIVVSASAISLPQRAEAWSPVSIPVYCPEGRQVSYEGGYPFFRPSIDLFSGLYGDIQAIRTCSESGFASYREFTREELQSIADLMKTDAYRTRAETETRASLSLWIEEQITGSVEHKLAYRLSLHNAYFGTKATDANTDSENAKYRALLAVILDGHDQYATEPINRTRIYLQIAFLGSKIGESDAVDWFERAATLFDTLAAPEDYREKGISSDEQTRRSHYRIRYDAMHRNIGGVRLCLFAPDDLAERLCAAVLNAQDGRSGYHGVEKLAQWAFRQGPIDIDNPAEEIGLRASLESIQKSDADWARDREAEIRRQLAKGTEYFRRRARANKATVDAILRERRDSEIFKEHFDRYFISSIKNRTHTYAEGSHYYCDLLNLVSDRSRCGIDETSAWAAAHQRFPEIMAILREERRVSVLRNAARTYFSGPDDHKAVLWAKEQPDFEDALAIARPEHLRRAASTAGNQSVLCALGDEYCREPSSFDAAMKHLQGDDPAEYRRAFEDSRTSQLNSEIRLLAWCDTDIELKKTVARRCPTDEARNERASLLRAMSDRFDEEYADARIGKLKDAAGLYGRLLALSESGHTGYSKPEYDRETLEEIFPEARALIEESRARTLQSIVNRKGVER